MDNSLNDDNNDERTEPGSIDQNFRLEVLPPNAAAITNVNKSDGGSFQKNPGANQVESNEFGFGEITENERTQKFNDHVRLLNTRNAMDPRASLGMYPRPDNTFKKKHSYDFDIVRSQMFRNREG